MTIRTPLHRFSRRRRLAISGVLLLAVTLAYSWWSGGEATPTETLSPVTRASLEETVTAQGSLEPKEFVDVGAQVSGQLTKVHVAIGDIVKKDQLLAEIDPKVYVATMEAARSRLKSLRAQMAQQKAQAELANQIYKRNQTLIKDLAVSKQELEESAASYRVAVASVESLAAQIEEQESSLAGAEANVSYTKIYAPMDGTVTSQTTREGQTINAMQVAPVILQIANLDVMTVRAQVAEADVSRVKSGMEVYFTTLGSSRRWHASVRQVEPTPTLINDVVLYNALVDVENTDRELMTQMSTQMFFVIGKADNALVIPSQALIKPLPDADNEQGKAYLVRVDAKGKQQERTVHIGMLTRTQAEVKSGLSEGEQIYLPASVTPAQRQRGPMGPRL